jgi:hypothetical protein
MINLLLVLYFIKVIYAVVYTYSTEPFSGYGFTELMINFQGGFVRRGLVGELLFRFCQATGSSPFKIIFGICLLAWVSVVAWFIYKFKQKNYCWWLLMSPLFLGGTFNIIRKDYICYIILFTVLYLLAQRPQITRYLLAGVFLILGLSIHEAFIFWGFPIAMLLMVVRKPLRIAGIVISLAVIGAFLILCYFKGDAQVAEAIYDSWNNMLGSGILEKTYNNSVGAIGWETLSAVRSHLRHNFFSVEYGKMTIFVRLFMMMVVYYLFTNFLYVFNRDLDSKNRVILRNRIGSLFIISLVCLLPMFLFLSCDYGRLYQYIIITTFATVLIISGKQTDMILPNWYVERVAQFNNGLAKVVVPSKGLMVILLFIVMVTPFCFSINEAIERNILSQLLGMPSMILSIIQSL